MSEEQEPLIHSHITDCLPEEHPLADESVYCKECNIMCHAFNNECLTTWVESKWGNYCMECFCKKHHIDGVLSE